MRVHCGQHGGAQKNYATKGRQAGRQAGGLPTTQGRQTGGHPARQGRPASPREGGRHGACILTNP